MTAIGPKKQGPDWSKYAANSVKFDQSTYLYPNGVLVNAVG